MGKVLLRVTSFGVLVDLMFSSENSEETVESELIPVDNTLSNYNSVENLIPPIYGDDSLLLQVSINEQYKAALTQSGNPNKCARLLSLLCFWS